MIEMYFLMHKDIKLAAFTVDGDDILNVKYTADENARKHLPVGYEHDIKAWLHNRGVPAARFRIQSLDPMQTPFRYMLANYGLSLSDTYWICPLSSAPKWEDMNLYNNEFRDTLTLEFQNSYTADITGKTNFTPSATLKGDLRKKWIIDENGQRILVKGSYGSSCIQAISEVFASAIYKTQPYRIPYVPYGFIKLSAGGREILGSTCPAFTNEHTEFVSAYDLLRAYKKPNNMNTFQFYKYLVQKLTGQNTDEFYDMMLMVDFVITNTDRHFNNFGVLRDADTLSFIGPAPVFDNGNSLFYKQDYVPTGKALLDIEVTSFKTTEVKLLKEVQNRKLLDIAHLPTKEQLNTLLIKDTAMPQERRESIVRAYLKKIEYLHDFQQGTDIWTREYRK